MIFLESYEVFANDKGTRFWGNAGAGVLIIADSGRILMPLRSKYVNEPFTWGVWGGRLDPTGPNQTETPLEAVHRELEEEAEYDGQVEYIPSYVYTSSDNSFKYYNYIGLITDEFKPKLNWETTRGVWMTLDKVLALKNKHFGLQALLDNAMPQIRELVKQQSPHTD